MSATIQPRTFHGSANALKLVVSFLLLLLFATRALAGESALAWDASPDPRVTGYNVYAGQASGSYSLKFDAGLATSYTVKNLAEGSTYYFAVRARDETGEESAYSNQASAKIPYNVPGADFSANVTSGVAPITVNFTSATTGTVTGYAWNFGDGGTSAQMNPAHAYAAPGTYTVSLTVNGPGGKNTATKQGYIVVKTPPPVASFAATPTSGVAPLAVAFSNTSTGAITSYLWDFGNGASSIQASPTYTYPAAGTYTVKLTATGPGGSNAQTRTGYVVVSAPAPNNQAPEGTILKPSVPPTITRGESVSFEGVASDPENHTPFTYAWDFGGGAPASTVQNPSVTFNTAGTYTVRLTVADAYGKADTTAATTTVTVKQPENQAPNGTIVAPQPPVAITQGQSVSFQASAADADNNTPFTFAWNFGDGGTSTQQNAAHAYATTGTYTVSLTVKDSKGLADPTPMTIAVTVVAPTPVAPSPSGLVAAYGFNEGSGTTTKDASGRGNTAALAGTRWSSGGRFGRALRFNGYSSIVTVKDAAALRLTTGMTLEAWVKPSEVSAAWRDVIYKGNDNYYLEATSPANGAPVGGLIANDNQADTYGAAPLALNTWTHLAVTYDAKVLRLYVNGVQVSSKGWEGTIKTSTSPLQIGGDTDYGLYFRGLIDEVRIYNRALSGPEIQADMKTPVN